jgi:hypothetical protein
VKIPCVTLKQMALSSIALKVQTPFFGDVFILYLFHRPAVISLVNRQLNGSEKTEMPLARFTSSWYIVEPWRTP